MAIGIRWAEAHLRRLFERPSERATGPAGVPNRPLPKMPGSPSGTLTRRLGPATRFAMRSHDDETDPEEMLWDPYWETLDEERGE
jgi:hypothetical protein